MAKSWLLVKVSNVSESMFTSNEVACHVNTVGCVPVLKIMIKESDYKNNIMNEKML